MKSLGLFILLLLFTTFSAPALGVTSGHEVDLAGFAKPGPALSVIGLQISLRERDTRFLLAQNICTGAILSQQWVLTAAHCFNGTKSTESKVSVMAVFGPEIEGDALYRSHVQMKDVYIHPNYRGANASTANAKFDLALVYLSEPLPSQAHPAALSRSLDDAPSNHAEILGYGMTSLESGTAGSPGISGDATLSGIGHLRTAQNFLERADASFLMIHQEQLPGVCRGDSGSPALVQSGDGYRIAGIAQSVEGPAASDACKGIGYFVDIQPHLDWIAATTGGISLQN